MWYHYIALLVAAYMVGSAIYSMVTRPGSLYTRWVFNGLYILIGIAIGSWAWSGITAPAVYVPPPMLGGRRRR